MLYTGVDIHGDQLQNLAFPKNASDPLLVEWVKPEYNPVIPVPDGVKRDDLRDLSKVRLCGDGLWRIAVAARVHDVGGATLICRSKDFLRWERNADTLYLAHAAGMVECPDLFPVAEPGSEEGLPASGPGARHVLKMSMMDTVQDYYVVGRYNDTADTFVPEEEDDCRSWRRLDYGHVYASKSFFDPSKNRRVMWVWANVSDTEADDRVRGWSGVQTVPRKVWLDDNGKQLRQWPIEENETLRSKRVNVLIPEVNAGSMNEIIGVAGAQVDVEIMFEIPALELADVLEPNWLLNPQSLCGEKGTSLPGSVGPFGLLVMASSDMQEHTAIFFRVFRHNDKYKVLMCTDLSRLSMRDGVYKRPYGAFMDMDIEAQGGSISLRTLSKRFRNLPRLEHLAQNLAKDSGIYRGEHLAQNLW